jgi:hypothetical protein
LIEAGDKVYYTVILFFYIVFMCVQYAIRYKVFQHNVSMTFSGADDKGVVECLIHEDAIIYNGEALISRSTKPQELQWRTILDINLRDGRRFILDVLGMKPTLSESVRRTSVWAGRRNEKVVACAKAQTFGSQVKSPQQRLFTQAPHLQTSIPRPPSGPSTDLVA